MYVDQNTVKVGYTNFIQNHLELEEKKKQISISRKENKHNVTYLENGMILENKEK